MRSFSPIFHARVTEAGLLKFTHPTRYQRHLTHLAGRDVVILVREPHELRSRSQNNYYHGVVVQILAAEWGTTPASVHTDLKREFGIRSTAMLETGQFETYLTQIRAWALTEFGIQIPEPHEVLPSGP